MGGTIIAGYSNSGVGLSGVLAHPIALQALAPANNRRSIDSLNSLRMTEGVAPMHFRYLLPQNS